MSKEKDLNNYSIRTDLVIDILDEEIDDNNIIISKKNSNDIDILDVEIKDDNNKLSKKKGRYITISYNDITDKENNKNVEDVLIKELKSILKCLKIKKNNSCLVVGLGNKNSTPDSLGPSVIDKIVVTRYLYNIKNIKVDHNYRNVSSFIPGVTGVTGIESGDIILGIIEKVKPDFIIIIDALASSSIDRINKTIQLTTAGINPGSGVYNDRGELSYETLGIPVIAIGVPTVIEANILVSDTIKYIFNNFYNKKPTIKEKKVLLGEIGTLEEDDIRKLISEVLTPVGYNMMVTPKEIDYVINKTAVLIADAINKSLHKNFDI